METGIDIKKNNAFQPNLITSINKSPEITEKNGIYSEQQRKYLENLYGLKIKSNTVLVSRGTLNKNIETGFRSCSVLAPNKEIPYYETGFLYAFTENEVPWVNEKDAAIDVYGPDMPKPKDAKSLRDYLSSKISVIQNKDNNDLLSSDIYSETVINLDGKTPVAIFDFRAIPKEPNLRQKLFSNREVEKNKWDREFILQDKENWKKLADQLKIPFITTLGDEKVLNLIQKREATRKEHFTDVDKT